MLYRLLYLLERAGEAIARKDMVEAKRLLGNILEQHSASPMIQMMCHESFVLIVQVTSQWEDTVGHLAEVGKLINTVLVAESEAEREVTKARFVG